MTSSQDMDQLLARQRLLEARAIERPESVQRLRELRAWQAARLARTYDDLRRNPRFSRAVEFFESDIYGPQDSTRRHLDLTRAWSYFKRALSKAALDVLGQAIELEVLTAELDQAMASKLSAGGLTEISYAAAYRAVGRPDERKRQIDLIIGIGESLERIVRHAWIGLALRAAHAPARAAGLGVLQDFLERGFRAFREMKGGQPLLRAVRERESQIMMSLFAGSDNPFAIASTQSNDDQ